MSVKLYAFTCGTVTGEFAHLMEGFRYQWLGRRMPALTAAAPVLAR
jgi:hypothetical protein